jgi:hypothetical protein
MRVWTETTKIKIHIEISRAEQIQARMQLQTILDGGWNLPLVVEILQGILAVEEEAE